MIVYTSRVRSLLLACVLCYLTIPESGVAQTLDAGQDRRRSGENKDVRAGGAFRMPADMQAMRRASVEFDDELRMPAVGTYDLVALRVEFQPDTSRFTTGDGTFGGDLFGGLEPSIDPLPHDADYFESHLEFVERYVERVSDGRAAVRTHLLPDVVQVSKPMGAYAPTGPAAESDAELTKLASLVAEAWEIAGREIDFEMSGFDPDKTAFVLFHAGIGRDVETIGTTLEKTPEDLPSLFFDRDALTRLGVSPPTFNQFEVDHTMIVPRTETRIGMDFIADEPFLLELSINGLLSASFFNFLGVPDLFDTSTGESAIGPFGLMDTQGIFAYRGLFSPEPMAWTKYFLGWTDPVVLNGDGPRTTELDAASRPGRSPSARAAVSDAEYFLVENRYRDPEGDGLTLYVRKEGSLVEQHVENGDPGFNSFVVDDFIGGVVVGVDNYDWALPGGLDEEGNPLNGGMLIWHIDERRLRGGLPSNAVNVGVDSRAIDLEEADGAQDIGFSSGPFGPQAELGTPFDFYYEGNPVTVLTRAGREVRLYENRFGIDTYPSSETNGGGPSFIILEEFSQPAAQMSFTYRRDVVAGIAPVELNGGREMNQLIRSNRMSFDAESSVALSSDRPVLYSAPSSSLIVGGSNPTMLDAWTEPIATTDGRLVTLRRLTDDRSVLSMFDIDSDAADAVWNVPLPEEMAGMGAVSPVVRSVFERSESYDLLMSDGENVRLVRVSASGASTPSLDGVGEPLGIASVTGPLGSELLVVGRDGAGFPGRDPLWLYSIQDDESVGQPVFGRDGGGLLGALPLTASGEIWLLAPDGHVRDVDVADAARRLGADDNDSLSAYPVLVDADGDGTLDVLVAFGSLIVAFSQEGAIVRSFPIRVPAEVTAQPLVVRFSDDDNWSYLIAASDGYLYAYDGAGRLRQGFPLELGNDAQATPALEDERLYGVSESGTVKAWELSEVEDVWWGSLHGDENNASFVEIAAGLEPPMSNGPLIDVRETYNWPNPIEEGSTHLRIRTKRDAEVEIKIIDAAGGLIDELTLGSVRGGVPAEIVWHADVQSGLYFARFTAVAADGERETRVVKMAVIR